MPPLRAASRAPRRRSSPARRPGTARRRRALLAAAGHPVVLGARRLDRLEETAAKIVADGGEAHRRSPLDLTDDASIDALRRSRPRPSWARSRSSCRTPATCCPATALGVDPDDFARQVQVNLLGAHRLVRRLGPGDGRAPARRHRVRDLRRRARAAHLHGRLRHVQERPRGPGPRHADGARGHRRARGHRAPRPVDHRAGHHLERGRSSTRSSPTGSAGASSATPAPCAASDVARVVHAVVSTPRGTHLTLVEVEPEAPVGGTA